MDAPTRNDMLASHLLFAGIVLSVLGELGRIAWLLHQAQQDQLSATVNWGKALGILALSVGLRAGLAYAVRQGLLAAKLLLVLGFVVWVVTKTNFSVGRVAETDFAHLWGYPLVVLGQNLLTLAALVVMFWPTKKDTRLL